MESWWMNKCNSTLPSVASSSSSQGLRNQMESAGYYTCQRGSQDLKPAMLGRLQDPLLSNIQSLGSHRSEHVNLDNCFLSLLSGSPSLVQHGFQDVTNSQRLGTFCKILPEGDHFILNSTQSAIPLSTSGLPSEKLSWTNLQSGADFCPIGSSNVVPSSICTRNSVLRDQQSSDLAEAVICHMGPGNEKLETSYASSRQRHSGGPESRANIQNSERIIHEANSFISDQASRLCHTASPADSWKACRENIHTSQKIPPEANSFISSQVSSLWHGNSPADTGAKGCRANTGTTPKMPVEVHSFISSQASSFMNGCPRVFCATTSGYLLLSNTGLLGIVCSCHSFRMSPFKFCEHSGLYGVNPGDAIRIDSGETISQWCKLYLLKFGIRIPGNKSEWDWPEELSAMASLMKCSVLMPKISNSSSDLVFSPGGSVSCKQSFDGLLQSNNLITSQSLVISSVPNKPGNSPDGNNPFLKALTGTSQSNLHMTDNIRMGRAVSTSKLVGNGAEDGSQYISAYTRSMHNRASSTAHSSLQEKRIIGKESDFCRIESTRDGAFCDAAISNFELRLGQPYQLSQPSGNPDLSAVGPPLLSTVVNPMKLLFPQQMNASRANHREEVDYMQCVHFSADLSNPRRTRDWNRLNHGINASVIRNSTDDERVEKSCSNVAQNSVISLLTNLKSPSKEITLSKANNNMSNENSMRKALHSEPQPDKYNLATVRRSGGNSERQLDMSHLGSYKLNDNDKVLSFSADGSHLANDLGFRMRKEMEDSTFNRLGGNGEPNCLTACRNSCYSHQLSGVPLGTAESRISSNYLDKVISFANSGEADHVNLRPVASSMGSGMKFPTQAVPKCIPVSASNSLVDPVPPFSREEFVGVHNYLHDDKLQVQSTRQLQEILRLPCLLKNQGEGRFGCSNYMQQSLVNTTASGKQSHKLGLSGKHVVSEAEVNPQESGVNCRIGADEGCASMTGVDCCCHFAQYKQGNSLHIESVDLKHQASVVPLCNGQPSPSETGKLKNVPELSEHEQGGHKVPCGDFHGRSSCAAHRDCLEKNFESRVGSCPVVSKVHMGTINSEASMLHSPQFSTSHVIQKDETVSLDHKRKLGEEAPKNKAYHTSLWRDVPSKVKGVSDVTRVDRLANLFDATREDREKLGDMCIKCFNGTVQIAESIKEHGVSNISSGCSAPMLSQPSIEVNNMDSSTNDAGDHGCGSNFVVDEGSGIDKAWSSDDALESENSAKFLASTGSSLGKVGPPNNLNHQSSSCLLDNLKLVNSLTWQTGQDQFPAEAARHDKDENLHNFKQSLKIGKRKKELGLKLNASCPTSDSSGIRQENCKISAISQFTAQPSKRLRMPFTSRESENHVIGNCITQSNSKPRLHIASSEKKLSQRSYLHKLHNDKGSEVNSVFQTEPDDGANNYGHPEVSGGKTCKRDSTFKAFRQSQIQESSREDARKTNYKSVDGFKSPSSQEVNIGHRKARPIVCGIYGELTDGSVTGQSSKPANLVPLSRVLSSSRKCIVPKHCNSKSSSMRQRNLGVAVISNAYDLKTKKYNKCRNALVKTNNTSMRKKKKECSTGDRKLHKELFSLEKQGVVPIEKDHQKLDGITYNQLYMKPKEIRKRSIYELTEKVEDPGFNSSSASKISKFQPAIKDGKLVNTGEDSGLSRDIAKKKLQCSSTQDHRCHCDHDSGPFCCVCGSSNQDEINNVLECSQCSIKVHQACYGVSKVPKGCWSCRPCRTNSKDIVCVLCGYGGGAMTQALRSQSIVESILRAWNIEIGGPKNELCSVKTLQKDSAELHSSGYGHSESSSVFVSQPECGQPLAAAHLNGGMSYKVDGVESSPSVSKTKVHNSITMGLVDSATKQWVHMVCGLWTPETRCPNVDTMSAFDVSGVLLPTFDVVCCVCKRAGGSCIQCRVENCSARFHPWCAHQKGLLQTEVEGVDNENVGFYGRCGLHATHSIYKSDYPVDTEAGCLEENKLACARTEGYKGRKRDGFRQKNCDQSMGSDECLVPEEHLNAWAYINGQKSCTQELPKLAISEIEHDTRKEYTRYKQAKAWKHLVVYKSGIHALGLYTSRFISRDEMVVEYVGEIVGQRVADKRENEYQSAKKLQYKSACYFFRIDKEHIVDATCKGGIGRFVNHSCLPNCIAKVISVRNEKKVVFLAERDIFPGEEITYDYHFNHEDEGKKIPCFCNSRNCRRYLN